MINLAEFLLNTITALFAAGVIGMERQARQHPAGLRTHALVGVAAALFSSLTLLMDNKANPTHIAAYIVTGIGFLGGGVIMKDGLNIRGMTTAATLWCSAAVGTLAGSGFPIHCLIGTAFVLAVNVGLRPVDRWLDSQRSTSSEVEHNFRLRFVCEERQDAVLRSILWRHVHSQPHIAIHGIATQAADQPGLAVILVQISTFGQQEHALQDLIGRLNIEPSVKSVSWEKA